MLNRMILLPLNFCTLAKGPAKDYLCRVPEYSLEPLSDIVNSNSFLKCLISTKPGIIPVPAGSIS
jgi:hypothetical protein